MHRIERIDDLQLNDDGILYQQIQPVSAVHAVSPIQDRKWNLPFYPHSSKRQLESKTAFVSRLKETRPKCTMYLNRSIDDLTANFVQSLLHSALPAFPAVIRPSPSAMSSAMCFSSTSTFSR